MMPCQNMTVFQMQLICVYMIDLYVVFMYVNMQIHIYSRHNTNQLFDFCLFQNQVSMHTLWFKYTDVLSSRIITFKLSFYLHQLCVQLLHLST